MRDWLRETAIFLVANEKAKWVLVICNVLLAVSGASYGMYPDHKEAIAKAYIAIAFVIILWALLVAIFYNRYGRNVLVYKRESGMLHDANLQQPNVAVRRTTILTLFEHFMNQGTNRKDSLCQAGMAIGKSFVVDYRNFLNRRNEAKPSNKSMIRELLEYDSSSGMGHFKIVSFDEKPQAFAEIEVANPFTRSDGKAEYDDFLRAYLGGMFEAVFERAFSAVTVHAGYGSKVLRVIIQG